MDTKVHETQAWLNATYSGVAGWLPVDETGITGWNVIYGLRKALQHELGISPVQTAFGPATRTAFISQYGSLNASAPLSQNLLRIINGALFCKGTTGSFKGPKEPLTFQDVAEGITTCREKLGLQEIDSDPTYSHAEVDVKLMASLLSMDAYTIPWRGDGTVFVQAVQKWLNRTYSDRRDFDLVPCDGFFSRQIQTALLFALQYEFGLADGTANGNFGPGTRSGLKTQALVKRGTGDDKKHFVQLFQAALRLNGLKSAFDGSFGESTENSAREFQRFMSLPETGEGDYQTWCNALVSSGDPESPTNGFDTNRQLTASTAEGARSTGYTHVGRYLTGVSTVNGHPVPKFLSPDELKALAAAGLKVFPIMQVWNRAENMTYEEGRSQALRAASRARAHGFPDGSTIYFAIDFDPTEQVIKGPVTEFFEGVDSVIHNLATHRLTVGVYGSRNVGSVLADAGLSQSSFVAGASTGWSGNMGFRMPQNWAYNQAAVDKTVTFYGTSVSIDKVRVSAGAPTVDPKNVPGAPTLTDAPADSSGIDVFFEWLCDAEVACEVAQNEAQIVKENFLETGYVISHWLRRERYYDGESKRTLMWKLYTPHITDLDPKLHIVTVACNDALQGMPVPRPEYFDLPHTAATYVGYATWGTDIPPGRHGLGDIGGWALDLLQIWGDFLRSQEKDLKQFLAARLGKQAIESSFSYDDLLADADAWNIVRTAGGFNSSGLREVLKRTPRDRMQRFFRERFAASIDNVTSAFGGLIDGVDFILDDIPMSADKLKDAANMPEDGEMPAGEEVVLLATALGRALEGS